MIQQCLLTDPIFSPEISAKDRKVKGHKNIDGVKGTCIKAHDRVLFIGFDTGDIHMFNATTLVVSWGGVPWVGRGFGGGGGGADQSSSSTPEILACSTLSLLQTMVTRSLLVV